MPLAMSSRLVFGVNAISLRSSPSGTVSPYEKWCFFVLGEFSTTTGAEELRTRESFLFVRFSCNWSSLCKALICFICISALSFLLITRFRTLTQRSFLEERFLDSLDGSLCSASCCSGVETLPYSGPLMMCKPSSPVMTPKVDFRREFLSPGQTAEGCFSRGSIETSKASPSLKDVNNLEEKLQKRFRYL